MEQLYSLNDCCKILRVCKRTLFNKIQEGKLEAFQLENGYWRVTEKALRNYVKGKTVKG